LSARLGQETTAFFERLTQDQPLVLICDDLHWLDEGSADVLLRVMELVEYAPIMLGFTLRPGQYPAYGRVSGAATTQFLDWHRQILLAPLDAEYSGQVVAAILGSGATPEFQERVYQRSRGNPLFIGEIARTAITAPQVSIPGVVQKVIEGRVDALDEGPRRTIKAASVIGTRCTLPELVHMLEEREQEVRRNLATLRRMQLIDIKEKQYEFVAPLVREVTYNGQSDPDRKGFHRRLGNYWAGQEDPQRAAHHYLAAEVWEKALEHSERAADQHHRAYANQEAIRLYEGALEAAAQLQDRTASSRLYHQLGQVYRQAGD
jgi:predicted ATPase